MMKQWMILLALSLLIVPYQNCSNPIGFTSDEIAKAETQAGSEDQIPDFLPNRPEPFPGDTQPEPPIAELPPIDVPKEPGEDDKTPGDLLPPPVGSCATGLYDVFAIHKGEQELLGSVHAYETEESAVKNYDYRSFSANPKVGPEIIGEGAKVFLLKSKEGLVLNLIFNQDNGGSRYNHVQWHVSVSDNQLDDKVLFLDEGGDRAHRSNGNHGSQYQLKFNYWLNTDGVIIGPLSPKSAEINVNPQVSGRAAIGAAVYGPKGKTIFLPMQSCNNKKKLGKFKIIPSKKNCHSI